MECATIAALSAPLLRPFESQEVSHDQICIRYGENADFVGFLGNWPQQ